MTDPTPTIDRLEKAAQNYLAGETTKTEWANDLNPQAILQLCAQLRIYKKHASRPAEKLF
ncbi:hypothetical protein [Timonella sp. A28]|uniref:hypothetical protein n=1 Tax=Timonella sp. A28 TaxID=3442640 RepID=UPI003EBB33FB